jgi:hypothetical protein
MKVIHQQRHVHAIEPCVLEGCIVDERRLGM